MLISWDFCLISATKYQEFQGCLDRFSEISFEFDYICQKYIYWDEIQGLLSKMEHGKRKVTRSQVLAFARYYEAEPDAMLVAWLSDRLVAEVKEEDLAVDALKVAEAKVQYERRSADPDANLLEMIRDFLRRDGRVMKAWLIGSVARGEDSASSDVDLMVRYSERATGTLLDYADLTFHLENLIHRRVDLVEEGYVKPFALNTIEKDKILIYG